jgi:MSHA biogenesis protein MshG
MAGNETVSLFAYVARDRSGARREGSLATADADDAVARLVAEGVYPSRLIPLSTAPRSARPEPEEIISFMEKLATLLAAGAPMTVALSALSRRTGETGEMAARIDRRVRRGEQLSEAMKAEEGGFGPVATAIVESGEATGRVDAALLRAAEALRRQRKTVRLIGEALRYPAMVTVTALLAAGGMTSLVFPRLAAAYASARIDLPLPTRLVMGTAQFVTGPGGLLALALLLVGGWYLAGWMKTPTGARRTERLIRSTPLVKTLVRQIAGARVMGTLAHLLAAGTPIIAAVRLAAKTAGSPLLADAMERTADGLAQGRTLSEGLRVSGLLPDLAVSMAEVGEASGTLDRSLSAAADYYEEEAQRRIEAGAAYLEPLLIALVAGLALTLALAVFLPIWNLTDLALHRGA